MHKPVVFMHHNPMGAHVTPPNRLRKLLVKDNSTRNEEAAVISTSCVGVDVIFVFTYGRDAGKIFGKCRKPHPRGAVHPTSATDDFARALAASRSG